MKSAKTLGVRTLKSATIKVALAELKFCFCIKQMILNKIAMKLTPPGVRKDDIEEDDTGQNPYTKVSDKVCDTFVILFNKSYINLNVINFNYLC